MRDSHRVAMTRWKLDPSTNAALEHNGEANDSRSQLHKVIVERGAERDDKRRQC